MTCNHVELLDDLQVFQVHSSFDVESRVLQCNRQQKTEMLVTVYPILQDPWYAVYLRPGFDVCPRLQRH